MGRYSAAARNSLISEGRKTGYGDITSRQMGAMGGSTTANLTSIGKRVVAGDLDSVKDLEESEVFIRKDNEAGILELDVPTASGSEGGDAPEAAPRTGAKKRAVART